MVHVLSDSWDIWMHKAKDSNWSETSYIKVAHFQTVEHFWAYFSMLNMSLFSDKMIFLMRHPTKPIWEDPGVSKGGYWSFKVSNNNILLVLEKLIIYVISEQFIKTKGHNIIGISTSPKKGFHIIKI